MFKNKIILAMVTTCTVLFTSAIDLTGISNIGDLQSAISSGQVSSSDISAATNQSTIVPPIASSGANVNFSNVGGSTKIGNDNTLDVQTNPTPTVTRPPVLPNEFQRSVQIRTGLNLPQYGYDQFRVPTTYNLVNNVPLNNNYIIGPGDEIFIQTWGSTEGNYKLTVSNEGTIHVPNVGTFSVAGVKAGSLESYLKSKLGSVYKKFQASATVSKIRSIQVNVAGYAQLPGTYTLNSLTNLSDAVFAVGGPASNGSLRDVQLKRNGVVVANLDMYDVLLKGDNVKDIRLLPGDIIYFVPKVGEVAIYDGVKFPGVFETLPNDTVKTILKFAGGITFDNLKNKVIIEAISNDKTLVAKDYSYHDGLSVKVSDGSIIHFMRMNKEYDNTVVLMGNVANPTRLAYFPGMTVRDVIPDKKALLTRSFWDSYSLNTYAKDNVATETGQEKTIDMAASNSQNDLSMSSMGTDSSNKSKKELFKKADNLIIAGPVNIPQADINWRYAAIIRINQSNFSTHVIPFDLESAINGDASQNITLQAGDVINILSSKDVRNPVSYTPVFVFIDGEVRSPGLYELARGESILDAVKRAGGVTDDAYVFGLTLQRKSVQLKQKMALTQMLDSAQQSLLSQSGAAALNAVNAGQIQIQGQILQNQQALINKMRQIEPTGRVVLRLRSGNAQLKDLPKFGLEDGDTIYIPHIPNTVDVVGQVYNPATFDYDSSLSIGDYIDQAGTENDYADKSREYVLQANGVLYSRAQAGWYGGFSSRRLNPGDTVIVPQEMQFGSFVQNLMNFTQIIANSAQAVALFSR